jgi:hypothetical protein
MVQLSELLTFLQSPLAYSLYSDVFQVLITLSPIVLTYILLMIFAPLWVNYVQSKNFLKTKVVLLDIKLPKETIKSPLAMELFLTSLHQTGGEGSWYDKYWHGKTRPWYSLEMVSIEGQIRFYIWTREGQRAFTESSLYAQFPGIEINKVDDYTKSVRFDPKEMNMFACEFKLVKDDSYPIKTYVDYGLDKDPDEEYKVDPLAPLIEFLGSVGFNQQVWIQIIVRAHKKEQPKPGHWWKKTDAWKDRAEAEVNKIMQRDPKTKVVGKKDAVSGRVIPPTLSKGEQETLAAIERSLTKISFDVGIRALYIAKKDFFDGANIGGIFGSFKQFSSESLNGFRPNDDKYSRIFSYPWQDWRNIRYNGQMAMALEAYKRRMFFYNPFIGTPFVLNSEELATIFHFPGQVAAAPNLYRVPSKKGQAPSNLPI